MKTSFTRSEINWIINNKDYHKVLGLYKFLKACNPDIPVRDNLKELTKNICALENVQEREKMLDLRRYNKRLIP